MKKFILLFLFWACSSFLFAQSITITPGNTFSEGGVYENIVVRSNDSYLGLLSQRYNGSSSSKTPVLANNALLNLYGGGYYTPNYNTLGRAQISFRASENWSSGGHGTKMLFRTTPNGATSMVSRMLIDQNGNVGIGTEEPAARLHVLHSTSLVSDPTVHLFNPTNATLGLNRIRTSTANTSDNGWETIFWNSTTASSNLITLHSKTNNITALQLNGLGDLIIFGGSETKKFSKLGEDAPRVKMKELSGTTSNLSGGMAEIVHGLTQSKILSVSILVSDMYGSDIPPGLSFSSARYEYYVIANHIRIQNIAGTDSQILGRPVRILITYKE